MLIGLVGKPSVGKSTFFKASTLANVEIASYPFTTIKANSGIGYVKIDCIDKEFNVKCNPNSGFCINSKRFVPIKLMDVAGLVPGASEGKGLGNQFLDDLRQADAFIHIVDVSGTINEKGEPTENYDPINDVLFLEDELNKWFYGILKKVWKNFSKRVEVQGDKNIAGAISKQFSGLKVKEDDVKEVLRELNILKKASFWNEKEIMDFASKLRKKTKPLIIAANKIDLDKSEENYNRLKEKFPNEKIIPCSAEAELALKQASKNNLIEYIPGEKDFKILKNISKEQKNALIKIKNNILDKYSFGTGVQEILNKTVFELLDYIAIFPASPNKLGDSKGNILPDCFLLPNGSTALDFAYYLHSDFGNNFIKAIDARTKKALGKEYKLKNRDALEIISR
jgi:ribosome-binding ATPase